MKNAIDSWIRIKTITYSDLLAKALPVLLARTFAHHYNHLQTDAQMHITPDFVDYLMSEALIEAELASRHNEVPVGAVIAHHGIIIGRGHNTTESDSTVIAHAELHAIQSASRNLKNWRLSECILCVTLEPCTMCLGAIRLSRIHTLIFGAGDSKQGAVGSLYDLSQDPYSGAPLRVIRGIHSSKSETLLKEFFSNKRI